MKVNKFFVVALLVTVLGCGYVYFFTGTKKAGAPGPISKALDAATVLTRARQTGDRPGPAKLNVGWSSDPFELPRDFARSREETSQTPAKLTAILGGKSGRVAVIGSEVVKKGDLVNGERVEEISRSGVVLGQGDLKRVLTLEDKGRQEVPMNTRIEVGK